MHFPKRMRNRVLLGAVALNLLPGRAVAAVQDPADSLYHVAREALNRSNYARSAELFQELRRRYPRSEYAPDACYWEAFARHRSGSTEELQHALLVLEAQAQVYPDAPTRADADVLATRIRGMLARRGDADAAERVASAAAPPPPPRALRPAREPRAPRPPRARPPRAQETQDEEDDIRIAALNALLQMDAERAVPILREVLANRDDGSVQLRRKALFLVAQKKTADTEEILLDAVRNDPDPEVRAQAVFWLSQVPTERAVAALDSILLNSTNAEVQEKAIFALAQHKSERASSALRSYAERPDVPEELREKTIFWLGQHRSEQNQVFLRSLYAQLASSELKEQVIFSVAQRKSAENRKWLMDLALKPDEPLEMRKKALFWLGQGKGMEIADLVQLYDTMEEREMREQLVFVYAQRKEPEAVDKLIAIARSDPDDELRRKAFFWLGQSKDPRVAQFLLEIINQQ